MAKSHKRDAARGPEHYKEVHTVEANAKVIAGTDAVAVAGVGGQAEVGVRGVAVVGAAGTSIAAKDGIAIAGGGGTCDVAHFGVAVLTGDLGRAQASDGGIAVARQSGAASAGMEGVAVAKRGGSARVRDRGAALVMSAGPGRMFAESGHEGVSLLKNDVARGTRGDLVGCAVTGKYGLAIGWNRGHVRGGLGALLVIQYRASPTVFEFATRVVDDVDILADTEYMLDESDQFVRARRRG